MAANRAKPWEVTAPGGGHSSTTGQVAFYDPTQFQAGLTSGTVGNVTTSYVTPGTGAGADTAGNYAGWNEGQWNTSWDFPVSTGEAWTGSEVNAQNYQGGYDANYYGQQQVNSGMTGNNWQDVSLNNYTGYDPENKNWVADPNQQQNYGEGGVPCAETGDGYYMHPNQPNIGAYTNNVAANGTMQYPGTAGDLSPELTGYFNSGGDSFGQHHGVEESTNLTSSQPEKTVTEKADCDLPTVNSFHGVPLQPSPFDELGGECIVQEQPSDAAYVQETAHQPVSADGFGGDQATLQQSLNANVFHGSIQQPSPFDEISTEQLAAENFLAPSHSRQSSSGGGVHFLLGGSENPSESHSMTDSPGAFAMESASNLEEHGASGATASEVTATSQHHLTDTGSHSKPLPERSFAGIDPSLPPPPMSGIHHSTMAGTPTANQFRKPVLSPGSEKIPSRNEPLGIIPASDSQPIDSSFNAKQAVSQTNVETVACCTESSASTSEESLFVPLSPHSTADSLSSPRTDDGLGAGDEHRLNIYATPIVHHPDSSFVPVRNVPASTAVIPGVQCDANSCTTKPIADAVATLSDTVHLDERDLEKDVMTASSWDSSLTSGQNKFGDSLTGVQAKVHNPSGERQRTVSGSSTELQGEGVNRIGSMHQKARRETTMSPATTLWENPEPVGVRLVPAAAPLFDNRPVGERSAFHELPQNTGTGPSRSGAGASSAEQVADGRLHLHTMDDQLVPQTPAVSKSSRSSCSNDNVGFIDTTIPSGISSTVSVGLPKQMGGLSTMPQALYNMPQADIFRVESADSLTEELTKSSEINRSRHSDRGSLTSGGVLTVQNTRKDENRQAASGVMVDNRSIPARHNQMAASVSGRNDAILPAQYQGGPKGGPRRENDGISGSSSRAVNVPLEAPLDVKSSTSNSNDLADLPRTSIGSSGNNVRQDAPVGRELIQQQDVPIRQPIDRSVPNSSSVLGNETQSSRGRPVADGIGKDIPGSAVRPRQYDQNWPSEHHPQDGDSRYDVKSRPEDRDGPQSISRSRRDYDDQYYDRPGSRGVYESTSDRPDSRRGREYTREDIPRLWDDREQDRPNRTNHRQGYEDRQMGPRSQSQQNINDRREPQRSSYDVDAPYDRPSSRPRYEEPPYDRPRSGQQVDSFNRPRSRQGPEELRNRPGSRQGYEDQYNRPRSRQDFEDFERPRSRQNYPYHAEDVRDRQYPDDPYFSRSRSQRGYRESYDRPRSRQHSPEDRANRSYREELSSRPRSRQALDDEFDRSSTSRHSSYADEPLSARHRSSQGYGDQDYYRSRPPQDAPYRRGVERPGPDASRQRGPYYDPYYDPRYADYYAGYARDYNAYYYGPYGTDPYYPYMNPYYRGYYEELGGAPPEQAYSGSYEDGTYSDTAPDRHPHESRGSTPLELSSADQFARTFQTGSRPSSALSANMAPSPIGQTHDFQYSSMGDDQSFGYSSERVEEPAPVPQRMTPEKFIYPHTRASFAPNGRLIHVLPNSPYDGQPATLEIIDVAELLSTTQEVEEIKQFPGPLVRVETHKNDVLHFCQKMAAECRDDTDLIDRDSAELLWRFLALLIKQNGTLLGTDLADLLLEGHVPVSGRSGSLPVQTSPDMEGQSDTLSDQHDNLNTTVVSDRALVNQDSSFTDNANCELVDRFRQLLLYGRKKDALEWAMKKNLWGHAMFLASKMDAKTHASILMRFANVAMKMNDPLQTLYQIMSGRQPAAATLASDSKWGDWRPHLSIILSNPTQRPELDRKSIVTLGDSLASRGFLHASHFCYIIVSMMMARDDVNQSLFGMFNNRSSKLVLLGASHSLPLEIFIGDVSAIQCTEVYEYSMSLGNAAFMLPNFHMYKYLYMLRLIDYGFLEEALRYAEVLGHSIVARPNLYTMAMVHGVHEFAVRLRYFDSQRALSEDAGEPEWLQQLRVVSQGVKEGRIVSWQSEMDASVANMSAYTAGDTGNISVGSHLYGQPGDQSSFITQSQSYPVFHQSTLTGFVPSSQTVSVHPLPAQSAGTITAEQPMPAAEVGGLVAGDGQSAAYNSAQYLPYPADNYNYEYYQGGVNSEAAQQTGMSQGMQSEVQQQQQQASHGEVQTPQMTWQEYQQSLQQVPQDTAVTGSESGPSIGYSVSTSSTAEESAESNFTSCTKNTFSYGTDDALGPPPSMPSFTSRQRTTSSSSSNHSQYGAGSRRDSNAYPDHRDATGAQADGAKVPLGAVKKTQHWPGEEQDNEDGHKPFKPPGAQKDKTKGWFPSLFDRWKNRPKEMILPDDKDPKIVWDPVKNRYVNKEEENDGSKGEDEKRDVAPPTDVDLKQKLPPSFGTLPNQSRHYNRPKARGARNYVDVLGGTKPTAPSGNLFNVLPKSASMPANIFIPNALASNDEQPATDKQEAQQVSESDEYSNFEQQRNQSQMKQSNPPAQEPITRSSQEQHADVTPRPSDRQQIAPIASSANEQLPPAGGPPMMFNPSQFGQMGSRQQPSGGTGLHYGQRRQYPRK